MDDIQPDLNKPPPHAEGDLLKQNVKTTFGRRGWRKYFFVVKKDKLMYFRKKEDYVSNKDPITFVKMLQVTEITGAVFSGVPKKNHLNCGFSVVSFHPLTQEEQTFNLLAETQESMKNWVYNLRYIKVYFSKMEVRDTVLSADQERRLLDRILREEEDNDRDDDLYGDFGGDGEGGSPSDEQTSRQVTVCFSNENKVKVSLSASQTAAELLEMTEVKRHLSSSSAYIVVVDDNGKDTIVTSDLHPTLYISKNSILYAVEHTFRLLVIFINGLTDFKVIYASPHATDSEIIKHPEVSLMLDYSGIANRGLFLKHKDSELPFGLGESPCEVLFEEGIGGEIKRLPVGQLVVKNKTLGGGRITTKLSTRKNIRTIRNPGKNNGQDLKDIDEDEDAQAKALDALFTKKKGGGREEFEQTTVLNFIGEDFVVTPTIGGKDAGKRGSNSSMDEFRVDETMSDELTAGYRPHSGSMASRPQRQRPRAEQLSEKSSPSSSPTTSPPRSRSRSPRRLPELPERDPSPRVSPAHQRRSASVDKGVGSPGLLKRRNATRTGSLRKSQEVGRNSISEGMPTVREAPVEDKETKRKSSVADEARILSPSPPAVSKRGPTIVLSHEKTVVQPELRTERGTLRANRATRNPSNRNSKFFDNLNTGDIRSASFGVTQSIDHGSASSHTPSHTHNVSASLPLTSAFSRNTEALTTDDEVRLENLFSRTFQQEQEEKSSHVIQQVDTLSAKVRAVSDGNSPEPKGKSPDGSPAHLKIAPMLIDFKALQTKQEVTPTDSEGADTNKSSPAINVASPSLLKVVLLQATEATEPGETRPMDFINLSGVCLRNEKGVWAIQPGYNYHDSLPFDCVDHTETFPLPGGIRAVYNHTHKRWHVYPPPSQADSTHSETGSVAEASEHAQNTDETDNKDTAGSEQSLFLTKKLLVTEIGSSFQSIMQQFEVSRDQNEKKKIGSDMTNLSMGHLVRGSFCSGIARLLLDGMKPYRFEGLVQDDIWKVTVAFSNEVQSNPSSPLVFPALDKLIFQPISSLKTVMRDNNVKYRAFVCLAMSKGLLTGFLEALPKQSNTLKKFYYPNAFLRLAADYQPYEALYQQILVSLEPMVHLPFDLSIDFESRAAAVESVEGRGREVDNQSITLAPPVESSTERSSDNTALRPIVVVKTLPMTGQRSSGNVKSVVWDTSPLHGADKRQATKEETDGSEPTNTIESLKKLQVMNGHTSQQLPTDSHAQTTPTSQNQGAGKTPWWKKISNSLMELNRGGAISGPPRNPRQSATGQSPPQRRVRALYNNIGDDADELCFKKNDILVVKDQINEEWLICTAGNNSGIVPISYVQALD